jgi:16S rRNA processing protein RimM
MTKTQNRSSGSGGPELRYLAIGKISRAHGLQGEVSVFVLTEFPERFEGTEWVYLGDEFQADPYRVVGYRWHQKNVLLSFEGITDRNQAEQLRGLYVQIPVEEAMSLPEGSYYLYQLYGLEVVTIDGQKLGSIVDIIETGANDVYVVDNQERQILLPAIADVIQNVDLTTGQMVVQLIDGLI